MKSFTCYKLVTTFLFLFLSYPASTFYSQNYAGTDVLTIEGIIDAYYEVISGPKGFKYDAEKDKFLHAPGAIITKFSETGEFQRHSLMDEQLPLLEPYLESFYEVEINRVIEEYGDIAHVWSTFEMRKSADSDTFMRGINSISLYYKENRWWIASWSSQNEMDEKITEKHLPNNNR